MPGPYPPAATTPTAQYLPLAALTFGRFQSFCRDLVQELPNVASCEQYGVPGDPQGGIDLVATVRSGETECYQCRRVKTFKPGDLRELVETVTYPAERYFVLIACEATVGVRDEAKKHANWKVWDIDDISARVRSLPSEIARRIVRTNFGGQACRDFLGVQPFATFLLPDEFFAPLMDPRRIFNHTWQLVGRSKELEDLRAFAASDKLVYVLSGRGGIGKSKILRAFAAAEESHAVYFTQNDVDVTPEGVSELPVTETIIVVDDAHRRDDLGLLLAHAVRTRTKLVLATRPKLSPEIPSLAARHNIDMTDVVRPEPLDKLSLEDVRALAGEVLGPELAQHAHALAASTRDCPLITIVGGGLLRDKHVEPTLLANDDDFHDAALARFFDDIVEHAAPGSQDAALRKMLAILAALSPANPRSQRFAAVITKMTGFDAATAAAWCGRLADHGVLSLHDSGYRIVPDVLSDYVLSTACATDTTFVPQVIEAVGTFDSALLRNLAAVDWRAGKKNGVELSVLGSVWDRIVETFVAAPNSERSRMLRELKEVGYFLPTPILDLADLALDAPPAPPEDGPLAQYAHTPPEEVLSHLPEVVRYAAYTPETFDRACDLLWRLALDARLTARKAITGEKDATSILSGIMAYGIRKPLWVQGRLLALAEAWLNVAQSEREAIALASVVSPLFATTGTDHDVDDLKITLTNFTVPPKRVAALRERAKRIATALLEDQRRRVVAAGVKMLKHAVEAPFGLSGLTITDEFRAACDLERIAALGMLRELVVRNHDPVIAAQVTDLVKFPAEHDRNAEVQAASNAVLDAMADDVYMRITMAVHDPWGHRFRPRNVAAAQAEVDAAAADVAALPPEAAVREISDTISGLRDLELQATPHILFGTIAKNHPAVAKTLFEAAIQDDASVFAAEAGTLLGPLHDSDPELFFTLVDDAITAPARRVCASVAGVYHWWLKDKPQDSRDVDALKRLFAKGGDVAKATSRLLPWLAKSDPSLAAELLLQLDIGVDRDAGKAFASLFVESEGALYDALTDAELRTCVLRLAAVPELDEWNIASFLRTAADRVPLAVVELLIERVRREGDQDVARYTTIPIQASPVAIPPATASQSKYRDLLLEIAKLYDDGATFEAPRAFVLAAGDMNATAVDVLRQLSASRADGPITFVANCLRGEACRKLVVSDATFAEQLLEDAHTVSRELFEAVRSSLLSCAVPASTTAEQRIEIAAGAAAQRDQLPMTSRARALYVRAIERLQRISRATPPVTSGLDVDD